MTQIVSARPRRGGIKRLAALGAAVVCSAVAISGCAPDVNVRGNQVKTDSLEKIKPGQQDRGAVRRLLGSPTNVATFSNETWYYISQKDQRIAFSKLQPITRQIVAISFDGQGRVENVKKYSLADAREIEPVDRVTPTPGQEFSLIQQLIGNLGRFEQSSEGDGF